MKKNLAIMTLSLLLFTLLCGCNSKLPDNASNLEGTWKVGATYITQGARDYLVSLEDFPEIAGPYDNFLLVITDDGYFTYTTITAVYNGKLTALKNNKNAYLLTNESVKSFFPDNEDSVAKVPYIIEIIPEDPNAIKLNEYDPISGEATASRNPYIYAKENSESSFIATNKTGRK